VDSGHTPHLLLDASADGVQVPEEHVAEDGRIVLNISPQAVRGLAMNNDGVGFSGRFGGQPRRVFAPIAAILAIYAKETGEGMMFAPDAAADAGEQGAKPAPSPRPASQRRPERAKPALKLVD